MDMSTEGRVTREHMAAWADGRETHQGESEPGKPKTTVYLPRDLDERLRLYVYSRKMVDPQISLSRVTEQALRDYFDKAGE